MADPDAPQENDPPRSSLRVGNRRDGQRGAVEVEHVAKAVVLLAYYVRVMCKSAYNVWRNDCKQ